MADLITGIIGAVLMTGFIGLIAAKLDDTPLWIVCAIGICLMLSAVFVDDVLPLLGRRK